MSSPRVLFICGSINQTRQLHAVGIELGEASKSFTPYYGDWVVDRMRRMGLIESTIGGNKRRGWCLDYLSAHGLDIDLDGRRGGYDLVVTCTDLVVPKNTRHSKLVVVQEGLFDPDGLVAALCRRLRWLPPWFAGTALTGESLFYDRFCAAGDGWRDRLIARGANPEKVVVTGIPGFDDCARYRINDFPHHGFVLVCTSDLRETFQPDNRKQLVRRALQIANGRLLIFKLHPNEDQARAQREIERWAPSALVYSKGSAEEMIANSEVLITQWSTTALVGVALGKTVFSSLPLEELYRLTPWQNGGTSAGRIAQLCRGLLGLQRDATPNLEERPQARDHRAARAPSQFCAP